MVVAGSKICGSAQRRLRNALIQHGSLILETSSRAPELKGLADLTGKSLSYEKTCCDLADGIASELEIDLIGATQPNRNSLQPRRLIRKDFAAMRGPANVKNLNDFLIACRKFKVDENPLSIVV